MLIVHKFSYLFIYLFMVTLGLCCCAGATLHCGARVSRCCGFSCCGALALGMQASVVVARRLSSCGSWALDCRLSSFGSWA